MHVCYTFDMDYRDKIEKIRMKYLKGQISLKMAEDDVRPLLREMNEKGTKIAKEHGKKFHKLTFGYIFR